MDGFSGSDAHRLAELLTRYWAQHGADRNPETMTVGDLMRHVIGSAPDWAPSLTVRVGHEWTMTVQGRRGDDR